MLDKERCTFVYFQSFDEVRREGSGRRREVPLVGYAVRRVDHFERSFVFVLSDTKGAGKDVYLEAASQDEQDLWVGMIRACLEKTITYHAQMERRVQLEKLGLNPETVPTVEEVYKAWHVVSDKYHPGASGGNLAEFLDTQASTEKLVAELQEEEQYEWIEFNVRVERAPPPVGFGMKVVQIPLSKIVEVEETVAGMLLRDIQPASMGVIRPQDVLTAVETESVRGWTYQAVAARLSADKVATGDIIALSFKRRVRREPLTALNEQNQGQGRLGRNDNASRATPLYGAMPIMGAAPSLCSTAVADSFVRLGTLLNNMPEYNVSMEQILKSLVCRCERVTSRVQSRLSATELFVLSAISRAAARHWIHTKDILLPVLLAAAKVIILNEGTESGNGNGAYEQSSEWFSNVDSTVFISNLFMIGDSSLTSSVIDNVQAKDNEANRAGTLLAIRLFSTSLDQRQTEDVTPEQVTLVIRLVHLLLKSSDDRFPYNDQLIQTRCALVRSLVSCYGTAEGGKQIRALNNSSRLLVSAIKDWIKNCGNIACRPRYVTVLARLAEVSQKYSSVSLSEGTILLRSLHDTWDCICLETMENLVETFNAFAKYFSSNSSISSDGLAFLSAWWDFCLKAHLFGVNYNGTRFRFQNASPALRACLDKFSKALFGVLATVKIRRSEDEGKSGRDSAYSLPNLGNGVDDMMLTALRIIVCNETTLRGALVNPSASTELASTIGASVMNDTSDMSALHPDLSSSRRMNFYLCGLEQVYSPVATVRAMHIVLASLGHCKGRQNGILHNITDHLARIAIAYPDQTLEHIFGGIVDCLTTFSADGSESDSAMYTESLYDAMRSISLHMAGLSNTSYTLKIRDIVLTKFISLSEGNVLSGNRVPLMALVEPLSVVSEHAFGAIVNMRKSDLLWKVKDQHICCEIWSALTILMYGSNDNAPMWHGLTRAAEVLAVNTSPLVYVRGGSSIGLLPHNESYLRTVIGIDQSTILNLRSRLLPQTPSARKLGAYNVPYTVAMILLEQLRIKKNMDFVSAMFYFDDEAVVSSEQMTKLYVETIDTIFNAWIKRVHKEMQSVASSREEEAVKCIVENVFQRVIYSCLNRSEHIHRMAMRFTAAIRTHFDWIMLRTSCNKFILHAVDEVESKITQLRNESYTGAAHNHAVSVKNALLVETTSGPVPFFHYMPNDFAILDSRSETLFAFTYEWICTARMRNPKFTVSILQEYIISQQNDMADDEQSMGSKIAQEIIQSPIPTFHLTCASLNAVAQSCEVRRALAAKKVNSIMSKASRRYQDFSLLGLWCHAIPFPNLAKKLTKIQEGCDEQDVEKCVAQQMRMLQDGPATSESEIIEILWTCASTVRASTDDVPRHCIFAALRNCCLLVLKNFTSAVVSAFVQCWQWLTTVNRKYAPVLLSLLMELLKSTQDVGLGVFQHPSMCFVSQPCNHEGVGMLNALPVHNHRNAFHAMSPSATSLRPSDPSPHALLIDFFNEYGYLGDDNTVGVVFGSLEYLFASSDVFNRDPSSTSAKFLLLCLGIQVLHRAMHAKNAPNVHRRRILRERIYRCALEYFNGPSQWSGVSKSALNVVADFRCLHGFLELVRLDTDYWPVEYTESAMNTTDYLYFVKRRPARKTDYAEFSKQGFIGNQDILHLMELLLLNELDRLVAWYCDSRVNDISLKEEFGLNVVKAKKAQKCYVALLAKKGYVAEMFRVCWMVSPGLALHMRDRFQTLRHEPLCWEMVGQSPGVVRGCHGAASLLVAFHKYTTDHEGAATSIEALSMYEPVSGPEAIGLVNRCSGSGRESDRQKNSVLRSPHSAPCVIRFVVRSIGNLPPAVQEYYLPQLVQLLRRDVFGAMSDLVVRMSSRSALVNHNSTWLLQAESVSKTQGEHGTIPMPDASAYHGFCASIAGPDPLPRMARALLRHTAEMLSNEARSYADTEVMFFNDICSIAARLTLVKDKTRHREIIRDSVLGMGIPAGLYMPTDPTAKVVGIDANSGVPMQSAAKCPFMLTFFTIPWNGPNSALEGAVEGKMTGHRKVEARSSHGDRADPRRDQSASEVGKLSQSVSGNNNKDEVIDSKARLEPLVNYLEGLQERETSLGKSIKTEAPRVPGGQERYNDRGGGQIGGNDSTIEDVNGREGTNDSSGSQDIKRVSCIFKVYDDCRQDALTVQVIRLLNEVYKTIGIPVHLDPYSIIPTRTGSNLAIGGIIETIKGVHSRDEIGKAGAKTLMQHFQNKFGLPHSPAFRRAQHNFARSLAGYAVVCHILSIKDRHNGNVLLNDEGFLCHIDYGFLLGISPGGNLGFETASFKLTAEMLEIMGGFKSEVFSTFMNLAIRGFLAARDVMEPILVIVAAMADSGLPCFMHRNDCLANLRARFVPEKTSMDAATYMKGRVLDAANKWTTNAYDGIQKLQQNIYSDAWR